MLRLFLFVGNHNLSLLSLYIAGEQYGVYMFQFSLKKNTGIHAVDSSGCRL